MDFQSRLLGFLPLSLFFVFMFNRIGPSSSVAANLIEFPEPTLEEQIDTYLQTKMQRYEIPGMAVAVVREGEVIYENYLGVANLETRTPVTRDNIFRLHSLSKIFVATGVFQLIEEGVLNPENLIKDHVNGLPDAWHGVRVKHLLTHSSGLPDIRFYTEMEEEAAREKVFEEPVKFTPGDRFDYNQTNFWLINKIIENRCDESIEEFVIRGQFGKAYKDKLMFLNGNTSEVSQQATGYRPNGQTEVVEDPFRFPDWLFGAAGINISLDAFMDWNQRLDSGKLVTQGGKRAMWQAFEFANKFPFAYGWGIYEVNDFNSFGFTGGGKVGFRKFPEQDLTVIVLTNGYKYRFSADEFIERIAGMATPELLPEKLVKQDELYELFETEYIRTAITEYRSLKAVSRFNFEGFFNAYGYELLNRGQTTKAVEIFALNVEENPESWNVHDSLGESLEAVGETKKAIESYRRSLKLNPENRNAEEKLLKLQQV